MKCVEFLHCNRRDTKMTSIARLVTGRARTLSKFTLRNFLEFYIIKMLVVKKVKFLFIFV